MTDLLSSEDYVTISAIKPMLQYIFEDVLKSKENDTWIYGRLLKILRYSIAVPVEKSV